MILGTTGVITCDVCTLAYICTKHAHIIRMPQVVKYGKGSSMTTASEHIPHIPQVQQLQNIATAVIDNVWSFVVENFIHAQRLDVICYTLSIITAILLILHVLTT